MIKFLHFLSILLITTTAVSQEIIFEDNFDDDKNKWTSNNENYVSYLKNGKLIIENNDPTKTKWHLYNLNFNADQNDFDIETTMSVLKSEKDFNSYGLVWSCYNDNSYYRVAQITPDKQNQLYEYYNSNFTYNKKWKVEKSIKGYNGSNKLKIIKRANIVKFYINDVLVNQSGDHSYFGSKFGFILDAKMKIEIENIKVTKFEKTINVVETFDPNLTITKLPEIVSSKEYEETNPVISADGTILYVDRKNCPQNVDSPKDDVWYTTKDANGNWTPLKNMGKPINNDGYNFVISTSPDNNSVLLGNRYKKNDGSTNGNGVSLSIKTSNGWEIPTDVIIEDFVNTNEFVGFYLASDNKHLLQSVERPEGYGVKDLYVSFLKEDNTWTKAKNLGNVINTFDEETNPFLAADGKTLYFASRGHNGYGGFDLFVSKRLDDTWTNWTTPQNLGKVINTPGTELSIFLAAKGDKAFISRDKDIWEIANTVKQDPVVLVKGKIYDAKTKTTLSAPVIYNDLKTNKELGTAISDPKTGNYKIVLPYGTTYSFMSEKKGYYAVTENVDLSNLKEYKEITVDLYLNPIEKGQTIRLNNIFFDSGKYTLLNESFAELDRLYTILSENKNTVIEIGGHTDAVGSDENNVTLSNNRANAVMNYLIKKGINQNRLSAKGYGESKFIAKNDTEEGKQQNRRVEFIILEM